MPRRENPPARRAPQARTAAVSKRDTSRCTRRAAPGCS